jgi:hypothetical protein
VSARETHLLQACGLGTGDGKCTRDGSQPSVGDATRALTLPQLPYGDAVHAELAAAGLPPDVLETGLRVDGGKRELFLRLTWTPDHPGLSEEVQPHGLTLAWSHGSGWTAHDRHSDYILLDVDVLAAPKVVQEAGSHLARHHLDSSWEPSDRLARWEYALELDIALAHFDEREVSW